MSSQRVLEDVHYFLDSIIGNAHTSKEWNDESIRKAQKWASHCENIFSYVGSTNQEMNDCLAELVSFLPDSANPMADLHFLQHAEEKLTQGLLQNPHLPLELYELQLKTYTSQGNIKNRTEDLHRLSEVKKGIVQLLDTVKQENTLWQRLHSSMILMYIWKQLVTHSDKSSSEKCLSNFLETVVTNNSMHCLLSALFCEPIGLLDEDCASKLETKIVRWINGCIDLSSDTHDSRVAKLVWSQPAELLSQIANKHDSFFKQYIVTIIRQAASMEMDFVGTQCTWKSQDSGAFTFEELVVHVRTLLRSTEKTKDVKKTLEAQKECIWGDVLAMCE